MIICQKNFKFYGSFFVDQIQLRYTEPLWGGSLLFTTSPLKFLLLIWLILEGWKTDADLEPPICFELGTPGLGIQHLNHQAIVSCFYQIQMFSGSCLVVASTLTTRLLSDILL